MLLCRGPLKGTSRREVPLIRFTRWFSFYRCAFVTSMTSWISADRVKKSASHASLVVKCVGYYSYYYTIGAQAPDRSRRKIQRKVRRKE